MLSFYSKKTAFHSSVSLHFRATNGRYGFSHVLAWSKKTWIRLIFFLLYAYIKNILFYAQKLKTSQYEWLLMSVFSRPSYVMLSWPTRENSWEGNFSQDWQNYSAWMNYFRDSFHKILQLCKFKNVKNELEKPNYNFMFGWIWLI